MTNMLERSILLTIGVAALALDMTEAYAGELVKRGQDTTDEGRKAVGEFMDKARDEARSFRGNLDSGLKKTMTDIGLPTREQLEEMDLKLAQLEHRLSLLENGKSASRAGKGRTGGESGQTDEKE